ncbi:MAG TPA: hypothetical protein ENJ08_14055 [Gammaproteobacteria bacterium]|nr:hypothetical protein [Gammaproteobacteria bacterium]
MKIQLEVSRNRFSYFEAPELDFSNRENFSIHVHIINNGDTPITAPNPTANMNWQPTYTVTGPSYPQGYTFSMRDILSKNSYIPVDSPSHKEKIPYITEIPPGTTHKANWNPGSILNFPQPGTHKLTLNMNWQGLKLQSNTVTINIEPVTLSSHQLIAEKSSEDTRININVFFLRTMGTTTDISKANFSEDKDIMSIMFHSIFPLTLIAPRIKVFSPPLANSKSTVKRNIIANNKTLSTIDSDKDQSEITLDFIPELIQPAVVGIDGKTDLFVLDKPNKTLNLIQFSALSQRTVFDPDKVVPLKQNPDGTWPDPPPSPRKPEPGDPATLLWTIKLPNTPLYHRASIAPPGEDEKRGAVLVSAVDEGSVISVVRAAKDAPEPDIQHLSIKGLHPVADSVPDIYLTADGELHAAVILISPPVENQPVKVFLLHIAWDKKEGIAPEMQQREITQLPALPEAIAIAYSLAPGQANKISWAILQQNGQVLGNNAPDKPLNLNDEPILPLQLLSLDIGTFLLISDKENVFDFQRLY